MRINAVALAMLTILAFASCKKTSDAPPSLRELRYRMYDSTYNHRFGKVLDSHTVYTTIQTQIQRIDTVWSDTTASTPFIIYRSDTLLKNSSPGQYGANAKHTPGMYFLVTLKGDSIFTDLIVEEHINHGTHCYTTGYKLP